MDVIGAKLCIEVAADSYQECPPADVSHEQTGTFALQALVAARTTEWQYWIALRQTYWSDTMNQKSWTYVAIALAALLMTSTSCDRTSTDDKESVNTEAVELSEEFQPLAGQWFSSPQSEGRGTTCIIRDTRPFSACVDCPVACLQSEREASLPEGIHRARELQGDIVIVADRYEVKVDDRLVVDIRRGQIDPVHFSGGLILKPLFDEMVSARENLQRQAALLGEERRDFVARIVLEPIHRTRLLMELIYTVMQAGFSAQVGHFDAESTQFELACRQGESNRPLFGTSDSEGLEGVTTYIWFCQDSADVASDEEWKPTKIEVTTSSTTPVVSPPAADLVDTLGERRERDDQKLSGLMAREARKLSPLRIEVGADGLQVFVTGEGVIPPLEDCPEEGPTICVTDGNNDFDALAGLLEDWIDDQDEPGNIVIVSAADNDVPVALLLRTTDLLRGKGAWEGERQFFEHIGFAITQ